MSKHRRNLIVDTDLAHRAMAYHRGQTSALYSLGSTVVAGGDYVSLSMVQAAIDELNRISPDSLDDYSCKELEDIIEELTTIADNPDEHSTLCLTGEDKDNGYATDLEDEDDEDFYGEESDDYGLMELDTDLLDKEDFY